jgi:hypothetical protein
MISILVFLSLFIVRDPVAGQGQSGSMLPAVRYHYDTLACNEVTMWTSNIGSMSHNPITDRHGFEWPRGSGKYYIYQDGLLFACKIFGLTFAGGTMYHAAWQPGYVRADGMPSDPYDPRMRLFRARRIDSAAFAILTLDEQKAIQTDYEEWPAELGAPWNDVHADGQYDADFDAWLHDPATTDGPSILGDEMLWCTMNDLDASVVRDLFGTNPVGMEMHTTVWAYKYSDCRSRAIFTRHRLIHKGIDNLDSMYLSIWSDPDVGFPADDYVGIDTSLQMAYAYNALPYDSLHGDVGVLGYLLLQGPTVDSRGSTARFAGRDVANKQNLSFTAFTMYSSAYPQFEDPQLKDPLGASMLFNNARGLFASGHPFIDPHTGDTTTMMLAGDPITGQGWLDRDKLPPGDRRLLASIGPLTLAVGDTQEVIYARIVAEGGTPAEDITALRETAECIVRSYRDIPLNVSSPIAREDFRITGISPNPGIPGQMLSLDIAHEMRSDKQITVQLIDLLGRRMAERTLQLPSYSPARIPFSLPVSLTSGLYSLHISHGSQAHVQTLLVLQ